MVLSSFVIPPDPSTDDLQGATAIVDTNVLLEITSWHDVLNAYKNVEVEEPETPYMRHRRARVRESILLGIYLHKQKAVTYSLVSELVDLLARHAPPEARDFNTEYAKVVIHYIFDDIWRDWRKVGPDRGSGVEPRAHAADRELVRVAQAYRLPLITNEGNTPEGINENNGMRKLARANGVTLVTPKEFWERKLDPEVEIRCFQRHLAKRQESFCRNRGDRAEAVQAIGRACMYLDFVLNSEQHPEP